MEKENKNKMTTQQAIKKMFPDLKQKELSILWKMVFSSEMSEIFNKITIDPIVLDHYLISKYGEYQGSLKDFIIKKFGEDVFKAIK